MGVGSGLPLCLAGINISNQARNMKKNALSSPQREAESPEELDSGEDCQMESEMDSEMETRKVELAKQMQVLDHRRQVLKEQRMRQEAEAESEAHQSNWVRKVSRSSESSRMIHSHGAKAA